MSSKLEVAQEIARKRFPTFQGVIQGTLAKIYARSGRIDEAKSTLESGEQHILQIERKTVKAKFLANKAIVHAIAGNIETARNTLDEALDVYEQVVEKGTYYHPDLVEAQQTLAAHIRESESD